uniref:Uncharacterized protein n=1 Tax=Manihot esculenta TaxID=3983 RepID=A0A2C9VAF0_MANES
MGKNFISLCDLWSLYSFILKMFLLDFFIMFIFGISFLCLCISFLVQLYIVLYISDVFWPITDWVARVKGLLGVRG